MHLLHIKMTEIKSSGKIEENAKKKFARTEVPLP